ncbi:hypothetical protein PCE31106_02926 [Pandoraea cepalis]|uniref:Type IV / VI secretion system DotU domain-containing protein n=1 Tax=Pandoraea cepalis TaxID=2508294 RepID=A0A5E4VXY6_9BURK|nr:DotU family type IV/VI secretion system protein [Pandoraea cepalis]VVE16991.1 hypothetical protein PCE31106_02926 [Pandoraea cepalis]
MNTLTVEVADPANAGDAALSTHASVPAAGPIRPLVRDVALLVATLSAGGAVPDAVSLRERCEALLDSFDAALVRQWRHAEIEHDLRVALCALLDETALRHLSESDRGGWALAPLQIQRFDIHDAGERVFTRLEAHLNAPVANVDVLEFYSALLGLGFVGRYALLGEAKRRELVNALNDRIAAMRPPVAPSFLIEQKGRRLSDWLYLLSPWMIAAMACVAAGLVWGVWTTALDAHLVQLSADTPVAEAAATVARP